MWLSILRYRLLAILCLLCVQHPLVAEDFERTETNNFFNDPIQPLASQALVLDIVSMQETAIAVGERGHIFSFKEQWQQVHSPTQALLTKVFLLTPSLGWAVGHDATILHTQNAGQSWQSQMQSSRIEKPFLDVLFFDEQHGVAVGAYGLFYRTHNGGRSWESEYHQELLFDEDIAYLEELKNEDMTFYLSERSTLLPHFNRIIALSDARLLMVGELGLVAVSHDLGQHWHKKKLTYEGSFFNAIEAGNAVYVMGLRGHLFKSSDLSTWQAIDLPIEATINGVMALKDHGIRIVGNAGVIIDVDLDDKSRLVQQRQGESVVAIAELSNGERWIAGNKGLARLTENQ
ncbi:WD40/YVTN/BNR-like repeat-containing protein [Shewanella surugensis]|uniref:YCF48-related protein n=1 Tax=Shewanella surugensis TaxID=212020 RepID=A0ABT0LB00_9GAMM|nr:YCF48-related protein [Shewanella surugensis]MCL1124871.1 YCF48-related protein [Shewanella surugensis]